VRLTTLFLLISSYCIAQTGYTSYPAKSWFKDTTQISKAMRLNFGGFGTGKVLTSDAEGRVHWDTPSATLWDTAGGIFQNTVTSYLL